jgi:hypothetical protein
MLVRGDVMRTDETYAGAFLIGAWFVLFVLLLLALPGAALILVAVAYDAGGFKEAVGLLLVCSIALSLGGSIAASAAYRFGRRELATGIIKGSWACIAALLAAAQAVFLFF